MYLKDIKAWTVFISIFMPISVYAGQTVGKFGVEELMDSGVIIAIVALFSLMGGIAATGIKTDADEFMHYPFFYKCFAGFWLGIGVGMAVYVLYSVSVFLLLVPVFVSASLGSAIMVFYMRWFADPQTRKKLRAKIEKKILGEDA